MMIHYSLYHDAVEKSRLINTVIKKKDERFSGVFFYLNGALRRTGGISVLGALF